MARLSIQSLDPAFFDDRLHFSYLEFPRDPSGAADRDSKTSGVVRVTNTGTSPLDISSAVVTGPFTVRNLDAVLNAVLGIGQFIDIIVDFDRSKYTPPTGTREEIDRISTVFEGSLILNSNDVVSPTAEVDLAGFWQQRSENGLEPNLNEIFRVFGFGNTIPGLLLRGGGQMSTLANYSVYEAEAPSEVLSPYWEIAPGVASVRITALAAYHGPEQRGPTGIHSVGDDGASDSSLRRTLFRHSLLDSQVLLPDISTENGFATATFTRGTVPDAWSGEDYFGFLVEGLSTDPRLNPIGNFLVDVNDVVYEIIDSVTARDPNGTVVQRSSLTLQQQGLYLRMFQALDASGVAIPNVYIGAQDFVGLNFDYNDNMFVVEGVRPIGFNVSGQAAYTAFRRPWDVAETAVTIFARDFDVGGQGVSYFDTTPGHTGPSDTRPRTDVDVSFNAQRAVSNVEAGEWLEFTIDVEDTGIYELVFSGATPNVGRTVTATFSQNGAVYETETVAMVAAGTNSFRDSAPVMADLRSGEQVMRVLFNQGQQDLLSFTLRQVLVIPDQDPFTPGQVPWSVGSAGLTILARDFDDGGQNVAYFDTTSARRGSTAFRPGEAVDFSIDGFGAVAYVDGGEWLEYTINVTQAGTYDLVFRGATPNASRTIMASFTQNGSVYESETAVQARGAWGDYRDAAPISVDLRQGVQVMRVAFNNGGQDLLSFSLTPGDNGPAQRAFTSNGAPWALGAPGLTVFARDFDTGGQDVAFNDSTSAKLGETTVRPLDAVDITRDAARAVGYTAAGEWLEYTINVARAGDYLLSYRGATSNTNRSLVTTFERNDTVYETETTTQVVGTFGTYQDTPDQIVTLQAGEQVMRVTFANGGHDLLSFNLDPTAGLFL